MAYTIATNAADLNFTTPTGLYTGLVTLVVGWFYPTTITAGRGLWSLNNNSGLRLGSGGFLTLNLDRATTDSVFTSGLGPVFTANQWYCIAASFATQEESPGNGVWFSTGMFWVGDEFKPPAGIGSTETTVGAGAPVASTTFYIGNNGTSTNGGFQGVIGNLLLIQGLSYSLNSVSLDVATQILTPFWEGRLWQRQSGSDTRPADPGTPLPPPLIYPAQNLFLLGDVTFVDLTNPVAPVTRRFSSATSPIVATPISNNACTFSQLAEPGRISSYDAAYYYRRPRR